MKKTAFVCLLFLFSVLIRGSYADPSQVWEKESSLNLARDQFGGAVIDGRIFVFGGNSKTGENLKSTEMFNPVTHQWSYRAANEHNGGEGVEELTAAVLNGELFVFGAWGGGKPYGVFNFVEQYNPNTNKWTSKAHMPTTRSSSVAVVYNGEIYVFGGIYANDDMADGEEEYRDVVEAYNPSTNTWRAVTTIPDGRQDPAVVVRSNIAYLFGGWSPSADRVFDDVLSYNFTSGAWKVAGITLPAPKVFSYSHAAPLINDKAYLIGGIEGTESSYQLSDRVDIYDFVAGAWSRGPALPRATTGHLSLHLGNYIYVIGGIIDEEEDLNTTEVWKLQVLSSPVAMKNIPWLPLLLLD